MQLFQGQQTGDQFVIGDPSEVHHCIKVTRHRNGDNILVTDFNGSIWHAVIQGIQGDQVIARITGIYTQVLPKASITLAISLTQNNDRFEWFVEKATETGVDRIVPLICSRTENKKDKTDRWHKIIMSSAKQCLRPALPKLEELQRFEEFITTSRPPQRYICHCENPQLTFLGEMYNRNEETVILIGPEGDFSSEEINRAISVGYREAGLGRDRLRVETAGIAAALICKTIQNMS